MRQLPNRQPTSARHPMPGKKPFTKDMGLYVRLAAIIAMILALGAYVYINRDTMLTPGIKSFVPKIKTITYDYNSHAGVYPGENGFFFYTKDGISFRRVSGEVIWNDPFDISYPEVFGAGSYLALAELRGFSMRVYTSEGNKYALAFDMPILNFSVNEVGFTCVKLQDGANYQTHIYNSSGEHVETRYHSTENIFPVASALSANGRQLALSLLDINGVSLQTHLLFAHVGKVSSVKISDGEWGGYMKDSQIIASLKFNGNNLLAASDTEISHYILSENATSSEGVSIMFENEVRELKYMGDAGVVLTLGRRLSNDAPDENTVQFYSAELSLVGEFLAPKQVTYLNASKYGAIVGTGYTYYGFDTKGAQIWQYTAAKELKSLAFLGALDTILEAGYTEATVLKRERIKDLVLDDDTLVN